MERLTQLRVALRQPQRLLGVMELRRLREARLLWEVHLLPADPLLLADLPRLLAILHLLRPRRLLLLPPDLALLPLAWSQCRTRPPGPRHLLPPALHQRLPALLLRHPEVQHQLLPEVQHHPRLRLEVATQAWYHRPEAVLLVLRALQLAALQAMVPRVVLAHLHRVVLALLVVWLARATENSSVFVTTERKSGSQSLPALLARMAKL